MGYTHYWSNNHGRYSDEDWRNFLAVGTGIVAEARIRGISIIRDYDEPNCPPELTSERVRFNGDVYLGHETFLLSREPQRFSFCKTAQKPYDAVVVAFLLAAERYLPDFEWSSDGDGYESLFDGGRSILDAVDPVEEEVA